MGNSILRTFCYHKNVDKTTPHVAVVLFRTTLPPWGGGGFYQNVCDDKNCSQLYFLLGSTFFWKFSNIFVTLIFFWGGGKVRSLLGQPQLPIWKKVGHLLCLWRIFCDGTPNKYVYERCSLSPLPPYSRIRVRWKNFPIYIPRAPIGGEKNSEILENESLKYS